MYEENLRLQSLLWYAEIMRLEMNSKQQHSG